MDKKLKRAVQIGLGITDYITNKRVGPFIKKFAKDQKANTKKGRKIVDQFLKNAGKSNKRLDSKMRHKCGKTAGKKKISHLPKKRIKRTQ